MKYLPGVPPKSGCIWKRCPRRRRVGQGVDGGEIKMDQAILLIQHEKNSPVASVLVTSKSSKSLKIGLKKFNSEFIETFQSQFDGLYEVSKFKGAQKIVDHIFDFVPVYQQ